MEARCVSERHLASKFCAKILPEETWRTRISHRRFCQTDEDSVGLSFTKTVSKAVSDCQSRRTSDWLKSTELGFGGEMAEWFKAHAWKACVAKHYRGFKSHSLRHFHLLSVSDFREVFLAADDAEVFATGELHRQRPTRLFCCRSCRCG